MLEESAAGRIVALDLGEVRCGVALSDEGRVLSSPLAVVPNEELDEYLRRLVEEQGVTEVVVGIPKTLAGEIGFQARRVLDRLDGLKSSMPGVRFVPWDERFTTRMAAGGRREKGGRVDHLAAAGMLQEYLELHARGNR
jgi:putative Holliday junction resolvase